MMKIFENWTFTRILPEPFAGVAAKRGKKDTTAASCLSVHNHMSRMKRATLHASTLKALLAVSAIIRGDQEGAFGVQCRERLNGIVWSTQSLWLPVLK